MRIMIDMGHPGHVHFFRNFITLMHQRGHEIQITARKKEVTTQLLQAYGLDFLYRGDVQRNIVRKAIQMLQIDHKLVAIARRFQPDLLLGFHNPYIAQTAAWIRRPSIIFTDTEQVGFSNVLTFPFAQWICTPKWFREPIPRHKHIRFNGFKELAYLHPKYFTPDPKIREDLGISKEEHYSVVRFISWEAIHDVTLAGIQYGTELEFLQSLEDYGKVFLSSERKLDDSLTSYLLPTEPEKIHSVLHEADLYIGEGGTMASESALLGTPAIHIEADAKGRPSGASSGNFLELRDRYDLLYFYPDQASALKKGIEILRDHGSKSKWQEKRKALLADKIDVTSWMVDLVENHQNLRTTTAP